MISNRKNIFSAAVHDRVYYNLFELSLDLLCVAGTDGYFKFLSPSWETTLGFNYSELRSRPFIEFVHPEDVERTTQVAKKLSSKDSEVASFKNRYRTKGGSYIWLDWTARSQGQHIYCVAKDITKLKEQEVKIKQAQGQSLYLAKMAALGDIASQLAHEINTPLGTLSLICQMLTNKGEAQKLEEKDLLRHVESINDVATKITSVIRSIKAYSSPKDSQIYEWVMPQTLLEEAILLCGQKLNSAGINLSRHLDQTANIKIHCQKYQVIQVMINLISNSVSAIKDLNNRWAEVYCYKEGSYMRFDFVDSGEGIPSAKIRKIFEPQFSSFSEEGCLGIGLSICKKIIESHHGKLFVETENPNTCISFLIPISKGIYDSRKEDNSHC